MMTVLLVDLGLVAGAGSTAVAAGAMGMIRAQNHRPPRPDYELIDALEQEDVLWRRREAIGGRSPQEVHLELDGLWRQYQTDDSPELRARLHELVAEYRQALADEEGGEEDR